MAPPDGDKCPVRFDDRFLEELKSRLRLSDVIGRSVKLRRQGREFVGLSPFNKEKSPSFYVNDDKGFYHDFSSGKHGDLISYLQETERLSFPEAVERLANEAGIAMPAVDPQSVAEEKKRQGLGDWLELAAKWFEAELRRPGGAEARAYLERRGLPEREWARFGIGLAPQGRTALKDYLVAKGARPGDLVDAGLLIAPEDGGQPYDRFRHRIIFPITDARGHMVSFGGRALDAEARAKYLNGPDTPLFDKGRTLYGLAEARKIVATAPAEAHAALVVVEGYMDVIACQRAGIAAVAPMGTALTEGQMEMLWRFHPEPTLCFDGDGAGQRAAGRVIERALPLLKPGRTFQFAMVEGGKDPDDVLRDQGPQVLKAQLLKTEPFVERLFRREQAEAGDLATPEQRTALKVKLRKMAATIGDADLAAAYKQDLLSRYEALFTLDKPAQTYSDAGRALSRRRWDGKNNKKPPPGSASSAGKAAAQALNHSPRPLAAALALAAIERPQVLAGRIEQVNERGFGDPRLGQLAEELVGLSLEGGVLDARFIYRRMEARGLTEAVFAELKAAAGRAHAVFLDPATSDAEAQSQWATAFDALMNLQALESAVRTAKDDLEIDHDYETFKRLVTERDAMARLIGEGLAATQH
jgi:DNA primase